MTAFKHWSMRNQLLLVILGVSLSAIGLFGVLGHTVELRQNRAALEQELGAIARLLGDRSTAALSFQDVDGARENLASLARLAHVRRACLFDAGGELFAGYLGGDEVSPCPLREQLAHDEVRYDAERLELSAAVELNGLHTGSIELQASQQPLFDRARTQLRNGLAIAAAALAAALLFGWWLQRLVTLPLQHMRDVAGSIVRSGDFALRAPVSGSDELTQLASAFNRMLDHIEAQSRSLQGMNAELEDRVAARTRELAQSNRQLIEAMGTLQQTQDELVRREKLASLGALVAGVAHELNTPLGNSLIVANTLNDELRQLSDDVDEGRLRRSTLLEFVRRAREAGAISVRNLDRAAQLIAHFKQVAVDQTSEMRRRFNLRDYLVEVVDTIRPQFKTTPHRVELDLPESMEMDSYPGPFGQVLTNLILNARIHAFAPDQVGCIRVTARNEAPGWVELTVVDDGIGIPAEHLSRVFDPFFTTRFGEGGSGLGLHIVFSLVVRTLGGRIRVDSTPGAGTRFHLRLPTVAPTQVESARSAA